MSTQLSAHQFKEVYEDLGYDLSKLGCIMLDTEPLDIASIFQPEMFYHAKDKSRFWIDGLVCDKTPHVTLLYGLLRSGPEMKKHVDAVLKGLELPDLEIDHIGVFDSPYPDEAYDCIVAHLKITPELQEINERLKFLPHINTFPGYKAHITLAYVVKGSGKQYASMVQGGIDRGTIPTKLAAKKLNYGGEK